MSFQSAEEVLVMATRVLGPTGSRRRRRFLFVSLFLVACTALFLAGSAQAVHDLGFQLDGDVSTHAYTVPASPPAAPSIYDWGANTAGNVSTPASPNTNGLFTQSVSGSTETVANNPTLIGSGKPIAAAAFNRDFESGGCDTPANLSSTSTSFCTHDDSTFATGSKDILGIGNGGWQCNHDNNVNNKIDIMNAYTASLFAPNNTGGQDHIIYFGLEKNTNNGTNDVGVWLLQGSASCSAPSGHLNFTGGHQNKDVLVVSEFSNGGGVSAIKAYQWAAAASGPLSGDGGCIDSNDNPNSATGGCNGQPISTSTADCKVAGGGDSLCATTNANCTTATLGCSKQWNQTVATPWLTANGSSVGRNQIVSPDFFEGGINITKVFQQAGGQTAPSCFSTVVPDTRSSTSTTATLFDFVTNQLGECHTDVTTTPVDANNHANPPASAIPAAPANADVSVQDKATIGVSGVSSFSGSISWHICGRTDPVGPPPSTQLCDGTTGNAGVDRGTTSANSNGDFFSPVVHITAAGRYCFRAEFSSTTTGVPPGSDSSSGECFTIAPVQPTLPTQASANVEITNALNDTATLGPTAKQPGTGGPAGASPAGSIGTPASPVTLGGPAQGTITFKLWGPAASPTCSTNPSNLIATRVVPVNGSGIYSASQGDGLTGSTGSRTPTAVGTYYWTADYGGDLPNTKSVSSACGADNESATVVDARISIAPNGVNEVNLEHTVTVTVTKNDGSGFVAASGASVTVTLTDASGASDNATPASLTGTTDANGHFTVTFTSASAGTVTGHAAANLTVDNVSLHRETNGSSGNSGNAVKRFVDANISISPPSAVNEVNHEHVFTITTNAFPAGTTATLSPPTPSISTNLSPTPDLENVSTCNNPTSSNGGNTYTCTVKIKSSTAGVFTLNATSVWHFADSDANANPASVNVTRDTDPATANIGSGPSGSGPATKRFVDLKITIGPPEATNTVGDPHTFIVTVSQDDGLAANTGGGDAATGLGPVPGGTGVTVTLVNSGGANYEIPIGGDHCVQPSGGGTVNGVCGVTFTSQTAGTVTGNASVSLSVGGVPLTRDTDPATTGIPCGDGLVQGTTCGPAIKHFVAGSISWTKVDNANPARALGGATFALCKTATYNFTTKSFDTIPTPPGPDCSFGPVVDNTGQVGYTGKDGNPVAGQFQVIGLSLGRYTVQETVAPPGYVVDPNTRTVELSPNDPGPPFVNHTDQTITIPFVDNRPIVKITGLSYTNAPDTSVDQPDGIVVGNTTFTVNLHNYGGAAAVLADSSLVVSNGSPNTGLTCSNAAVPFTLPISHTINAGANNSPAITLSGHYDRANGKAVTGTLKVKD